MRATGIHISIDSPIDSYILLLSRAVDTNQILKLHAISWEVRGSLSLPNFF